MQNEITTGLGALFFGNWANFGKRTGSPLLSRFEGVHYSNRENIGQIIPDLPI